jgi:predicted RNase H-like nuclease (RuvC/YqgF family)
MATTPDSHLTIIITGIVTFMTGGGLYKFYEAWAKRKKENKAEEQADAQAFRYLLLERVTALEKEAKANAKMILKLTKENAELRAENENMRKEISKLRKG